MRLCWSCTFICANIDPVILISQGLSRIRSCISFSNLKIRVYQHDNNNSVSYLDARTIQTEQCGPKNCVPFGLLSPSQRSRQKRRQFCRSQTVPGKGEVRYQLQEVGHYSELLHTFVQEHGLQFSQQLGKSPSTKGN